MIFIFSDSVTELNLPVTPPSFRIPHGIKIETINIHELGDVNLAGYGTLPTIKIDCMFPAHNYDFVVPGSNTVDPYVYVAQFQSWIDTKAVLRFVISNTPVNIAVLIEEIEYGENDGTGDVYASLVLRGHREMSTTTTATNENGTRLSATSVTTTQTYTVKKGDTLSAICRRFYGNASLYAKLAKYNSIANYNLIKVGQLIKLPDKSLL